MRVSTPLLLLAVSLMTPACTTLSTATAPKLAAADVVKRICAEAWLPIHYASKHDTAQTVSEAKANNRARSAFCK